MLLLHVGRSGGVKQHQAVNRPTISIPTSGLPSRRATYISLPLPAPPPHQSMLATASGKNRHGTLTRYSTNSTNSAKVCKERASTGEETREELGVVEKRTGQTPVRSTEYGVSAALSTSTYHGSSRSFCSGNAVAQLKIGPSFGSSRTKCTPSTSLLSSR